MLSEERFINGFKCEYSQSYLANVHETLIKNIYNLLQIIKYFDNGIDMNNTLYNNNTKFILFESNWACYERNFQIADIPIDYIPEIAYAFFNIAQGSSGWEVVLSDAYADTDKLYSTNGVQPLDTLSDGLPFHGNFGQFQKLQKQGKKFNLKMAVLGWTYSTNMSDAMATASDRQSMVDSIVKIMTTYPIFNGVCFDWEYISDNGVNYGNTGNACRQEDPVNFALFLSVLKPMLGYYTIALCVTAAPEKIMFDPTLFLPYLDEFQLMTYDFHSSSWGDVQTSHQTNARKSSFGVPNYSCEQAADAWIAKGVPSTKILIGAVMYSRGFANTAGLGQTASGVVSDMSWEAGCCDYKTLPRPGATEFWDDEAKATYSYDPVEKIFNSYDTIASIQEKCKLVNEKNLKGIIVWEGSADYPITDPRSLTKELYNNLCSA